VGSLLRDVRHAWRTILRMPVLSAVIVVSLGIGIGVNTTIFSWIQTMVFRPMPGVTDSGSFYFIEAVSESGSYVSTSWPEYLDLGRRLTRFQELTAARMAPLYVGEAGKTERAYGQLVSGNFFHVLGLQPQLGRTLGPGDVRTPGAEPVLVISHDYWQTHFNGAADVIGKPLRVNDRVLTIIGVAPRDFQGSVLGLSFDIWLPATLAPVIAPGSKELDDRAIRGYSVMGRLRPGATAAQAGEEAGAAMRELAIAYPASNDKVTAEVLQYFDAPRGPQRFFASALFFLQVVMLLLLLTVCGNTANLVLARASARQREVGVRLALGAPPRRIASLLLTENVMLALMGAALGALLAVWGTEALRAVPMTGAFPVKFQTRVDLIGLALTMLLGLICGLLFGVPPAAQLAKLDPLRALKAGSRSSSQGVLRSALMGTQVALALVLLVVAALFYRSFRESKDTDPGFRTEGVLLAAYDLTGRTADDRYNVTFADKLLARLNALPMVEAAAIATAVPLDIHGLSSRSFTLEGRARDDGNAEQALTNTVTPRYFETLGIPFLAGTDFAALSDPSAAPQVIVNDAFVRRYLDGAEPIGRRLESRGLTYTIVGVVKTSTYNSFGETPAPIVHFAYRDRSPSFGEIHLRSRPGLEDALASAVRAAVREIDIELPVYNVRTMTEHIDRNLVLRKIPTRMFVVLGPLLLILAAIGIYAVVSYSVSQRTTEISVRLALGATTSRVIRTVVWDSFRVILLGAFAGWLVALMIDLHLVRGGLADLPILIGVPFVLLGVAAMACWIPARRAASVAPVVALRQD
jgi:predicted permease